MGGDVDDDDGGKEICLQRINILYTIIHTRILPLTKRMVSSINASSMCVVVVVCVCTCVCVGVLCVAISVKVRPPDFGCETLNKKNYEREREKHFAFLPLFFSCLVDTEVVCTVWSLLVCSFHDQKRSLCHNRTYSVAF